MDRRGGTKAAAAPAGAADSLRRSRIAASDRSSAASVAGDSYRWSRLFASALNTIASTSRGSDVFTDVGAGAAACTICSASAVAPVPMNGSFPVNISNRTMPSEKISVR